MDYYYTVFFVHPVNGKQLQRTVKGKDCLTALEAFKVEYEDDYQTKDDPHVQAIRRACWSGGCQRS